LQVLPAQTIGSAHLSKIALHEPDVFGARQVQRAVLASQLVVASSDASLSLCVACAAATERTERMAMESFIKAPLAYLGRYSNNSIFHGTNLMRASRSCLVASSKRLFAQ
jgi:hypothetical protein